LESRQERKRSTMETQEIWKNHPIGYKVSSFGNVIGLRRKKVGYNRKDGYRSVHMFKKEILIHVLVWETFNGKVPKGYEINHKDMNKGNNRLDNLELTTHQENLKHAYTNGLFDKNRGQNNPNAKLNNSKVLEIRKLYEDKKLNQREIGELFGVSYRTISLIVNKKIWKNV
jgi:predicted XRE-type DNA-binding protein